MPGIPKPKLAAMCGCAPCVLGARLGVGAQNKKTEGKKIEKGSAFPTCISVNNCVGHYSPLPAEDKIVIAEGDLVKIDLGVHVDGYVAVVAHTCFLGN